MKSYSNFYTHSDASCCAYQVQTNIYKPPPFSSDFLLGIISLPEDYTTDANKALYRKFIDSFGTNYIKQTDMGSLFGQEIKISRESWMKMSNQSINIDWSASWSSFFAWYVDADGKYQQEKKQVDKFNNFTSSRSLYTKGSRPPKDGSLANWVNEAKEYPAPIALELGSMLDLFTSLRVPQPIITNMNESLYNYCDDQTCSGLNPDREFPRSWKAWLTNFTAGQISESKYCKEGDYITKIQFARDIFYPSPFWADGIFDLCFQCATEDTPQCFNGTTINTSGWVPPPYGGQIMTCGSNGFGRMAIYETQWYVTYPINVKTQCLYGPLPQYAFPRMTPYGNWAPWVSCPRWQKIVGFQVTYNWWGPGPDWWRIMNFRFSCA